MPASGMALLAGGGDMAPLAGAEGSTPLARALSAWATGVTDGGTSLGMTSLYARRAETGSRGAKAQRGC
jgi:hypothetical protein